jgi:hypothetical protein
MTKSRNRGAWTNTFSAAVFVIIDRLCISAKEAREELRARMPEGISARPIEEKEELLADALAGLMDDLYEKQKNSPETTLPEAESI